MIWTRRRSSRRRPTGAGPLLVALAVAASVLVAYTSGPSLPAATATITSGPVQVYPAPGTRTASPRTQISIRGIRPGRIGTVSVVGSRSGPHATTLRADSDGDGASVYLKPSLDPGESVTVRTRLDVAGATGGAYRFIVSRPALEQAVQSRETDDPSAVQHFTSAPSLAPPRLTIQTGTLTAADGDVFLAPKQGPGQDGPMIVSPSGQLVWFDPLPHGLSAWNFEVQHYQGRPVLTWWQGFLTASGHGQGEDMIYNRSYQPVATVRAGNGYRADLHEFKLIGVHTALLTAYQAVHWDLSPVHGPRDGVVLDGIAQEIDIPTGNVLAEWHALGHVPLADSYADVPSGQDAFDYFHINSLDLGPDGQLLISARATHTIYDVSLATGSVIWQLGGKHSSFTGDGTDFSSQHDARWDGPDRVSLFNDAAGVGKPTASRSSGMVVRLDPDTHTATTVQAYTTDSVPRAHSQGNVQLLPGGEVFIGWGAQPYLSQYDVAGRLIWQAVLPKADQTYRAFRFPWSGHPTTKPSVVATASGAATTVQVSWNGATSVARWKVLAGASPSSLVAATTAADQGFQSAARLTGPPPAYVAVQALDSAGHVLATSDPVAVSVRSRS